MMTIPRSTSPLTYVSTARRLWHGTAVTLTLASLLAVTAVQAQEATAPAGIDVVEVEGGLVRGAATDVEGVQVFKGIPYAGSTDAENRFRAPQPVEPWDGIRVADTWPDQVMQDVNLNPVGGFWGDEFYYDPAFMPPASEDGLGLNVWTPARSADEKLPVYVWIHGGGNDHGYASEIEFYASRLAAKGIIVVPVQYRVGPRLPGARRTRRREPGRRLRQLRAARPRRGPALGPRQRRGLRRRPRPGHPRWSVCRRRQHRDAAPQSAGQGALPSRGHREHRKQPAPVQVPDARRAEGGERCGHRGGLRQADEPPRPAGASGGGVHRPRGRGHEPLLRA